MYWEVINDRSILLIPRRKRDESKIWASDEDFVMNSNAASLICANRHWCSFLPDVLHNIVYLCRFTIFRIQNGIFTTTEYVHSGHVSYDPMHCSSPVHWCFFRVLLWKNIELKTGIPVFTWLYRSSLSFSLSLSFPFLKFSSRYKKSLFRQKYNPLVSSFVGHEIWRIVISVKVIFKGLLKIGAIKAPKTTALTKN